VPAWAKEISMSLSVNQMVGAAIVGELALSAGTAFASFKATEHHPSERNLVAGVGLGASVASLIASNRMGPSMASIGVVTLGFATVGAGIGAVFAMAHAPSTAPHAR
jgi:hypothetical protein